MLHCRPHARKNMLKNLENVFYNCNFKLNKQQFNLLIFRAHYYKYHSVFNYKKGRYSVLQSHFVII